MSSVLFPKPGDLIQFQKTYYTHWAVLVRDKYIIHVQAPGGGKKGNVIIKKMKLDDYLKDNLLPFELWIDVKMHVVAPVEELGGCWASVNNNFDKVKKPFHVDEIIRRAEDMVGKKWDYDLFQHNCEHFAHWCRYGIKVCKQSPNFTEYEDEDGNKYECGQVWGPNLGPVDFKFLSMSDVHESAPGRDECRTNIELVSVGVANLARAGVGVERKKGVYNDGNGIGFQEEGKYVEADVGPVNAKLGLGVSTGIDTKDGLKVEVLGTGLNADSERLEVRVLGSSVAVKYPWKWFG
ncbi:hypothetical protein WR25_02010 [Diploscapter pachys]|uniref:LRAT domain-containing protein n=1 Tax=Diploscapter pachys TaxID=2018661 RepID=A0A2A2JNI1_9BILA|nr:hypothetical protein WR25_02010 [Diploscapter pachys]